MKAYLLAAMFSLSALAAPVSPARAAEAKQDFSLVNLTGYEIKEVYVSPSKATDWQEDVLGDDTLPNKSSVHITFHRSDKTCHWDLKVVYAVDSSNAYWENIDLCAVSKITIRYNKETDKTSATFD
jgi:hypothetical protein